MSHSIELSPPQEPAAYSTEVVPTAKKKRYSSVYKLRVIEEADRCTAPGELGALLLKFRPILFTPRALADQVVSGKPCAVSP